MMNSIDETILRLLAADARRALADIGADVGLSPSAVNERIRRLVARGVIRRFTVEVDPDALNRSILAFVWATLAETGDEAKLHAQAGQDPRVIECHHVTGEWRYLLKVRVESLAALEDFMTELKAAGQVGRSHAVVAMSSPVADAYVPTVG